MFAEFRRSKTERKIIQQLNDYTNKNIKNEQYN